jgi:hypothetical protein
MDQLSLLTPKPLRKAWNKKTPKLVLYWYRTVAMATGFGYRTLSLVMLCTHFFNHFNQAFAPLLFRRGGARRGERGEGDGRQWEVAHHNNCIIIAATILRACQGSVGEMNEFSVGGNHTHLSTYSTTQRRQPLPPATFFLSASAAASAGKKRTWRECMRNGNCAPRPWLAAVGATALFFSFLLWRSQMPSCVFSFPHALSGLGADSILAIIAGSGSLNPPGSDNCRAWLCVCFFEESKN